MLEKKKKRIMDEDEGLSKSRPLAHFALVAHIHLYPLRTSGNGFKARRRARERGGSATHSGNKNALRGQRLEHAMSIRPLKRKNQINNGAGFPAKARV